MAQQSPAESATITPQYSLLESVDKLDELRSRMSFVLDALTQADDWIEPESATGLYFTIQSIQSDIDDVRDSVHAEVLQ